MASSGTLVLSNYQHVHSSPIVRTPPAAFANLVAGINSTQCSTARQTLHSTPKRVSKEKTRYGSATLFRKPLSRVEDVTDSSSRTNSPTYSTANSSIACSRPKKSKKHRIKEEISGNDERRSNRRHHRTTNTNNASGVDSDGIYPAAVSGMSGRPHTRQYNNQQQQRGRRPVRVDTASSYKTKSVYNKSAPIGDQPVIDYDTCPSDSNSSSITKLSAKCDPPSHIGPSTPTTDSNISNFNGNNSDSCDRPNHFNRSHIRVAMLVEAKSGPQEDGYTAALNAYNPQQNNQQNKNSRNNNKSRNCQNMKSGSKSSKDRDGIHRNSDAEVSDNTGHFNDKFAGLAWGNSPFGENPRGGRTRSRNSISTVIPKNIVRTENCRFAGYAASPDPKNLPQPPSEWLAKQYSSLGKKPYGDNQAVSLSENDVGMAKLTITNKRLYAHLSQKDFVRP